MDGVAIQRIDKKDVHNICSGQVITSLRTAVKELVENALDASATSVEVALKERGLESIEVRDNGDGVHPDNTSKLGRKHHTSKLTSFADLATGGVGTFGFRGEAVSSLCALADVSMVTRHRSQQHAQRLMFSQTGEIAQQGVTARQVGTTVTVRSLFHTLPVRRKQFVSRIRRELSDLVTALQAYAIVRSDIRLCVSDQSVSTSSSSSSSSVRHQLLSVPAAAASDDPVKLLRQRAELVFGSKQLTAVCNVTTVAPSIETCREFSIAEESVGGSTITVNGLVSSCEHGKGRASGDRQFVFINGRPCDHSKLTRVCNDIYRQFNRHQFPLLVLHVQCARDTVDVNVTPDKRQMFLQQEKLVLATVKESVLACFREQPALIPVNAPRKSLSSVPVSDWMAAIKRNVSSSATQHTNGSSKRICLDKFFNRRPPANTSSLSPSISTIIPNSPSDTLEIAIPPPSSDQPSLISSSSPSKLSSENATGCGLEVSAPSGTFPENSVDTGTVRESVDHSLISASTAEPPGGSGEESVVTPVANGCGVEVGGPSVGVRVDVEDDVSLVGSHGGGDSIPLLSGGIEDISSSDPAPSHGGGDTVPLLSEETLTFATADDSVSSGPSCAAVEGGPGASAARERRSVPLEFSWLRIKQSVSELAREVSEDSQVRGSILNAGLQNADNDKVEAVLSRHIDKQDFLKMEVVGQFNLGFIITRLESDLFLVDQHASDEKFRFETLCSQPITSQRLVVPQQLHLPATSEQTILDHELLFRAAGFQFSCASGDDVMCGRRLSLLATPTTMGGHVSDQSELEELVWLLQECAVTPTQLVSSRTRAVLASKSCRTAVMIGTALTHTEMKRIVNNMAAMDNPWSCPHGRPTMRHLVDLRRINS